jgi:tetracycline 7-halogenase / FADH2 O2-dependent halogenase
VTEAFDLAILGSGFSGSLLAMVARRLGLSVLLLERGQHPRFAIGESTSPLTNLLLEELALEYDLPRVLPFASYGTWKRAYPEVTVGLKRGFSFYHHEAGQPFRPDPERRTELMVAASPYDEIADTHWYRAEFDHFLVREAQSLGAEYSDRTRLHTYRREGDLTTLEGERNGSSVRYRARFVVDATGPRGALSKLLGLPEVPLSDTYPGTQALFSHFTGVRLFAEQARHAETPPYPPDDAALHHVFEGGWIWVLRFENGITSAGIAAEDWLARDLHLEEGAPAWERVLDRFPSVREHFTGTKAVLPFIHYPRLAYRCEVIAGDGWAMLPSAAGFIDPLFSTGFPLTLLGIHRLARVLKGQDELWNYERLAKRELEQTSRLIAASYAAFRSFPAFADLSMLYFAAASFAEMARRLDHGYLATQFLLQNQPAFHRLFQGHTGAALAGRPSSAAAVASDLAPFNIAGLCDPAKRNWYGVDLNDVIAGAAKLHATPDEVRAFFERMGWA